MEKTDTRQPFKNNFSKKSKSDTNINMGKIQPQATDLEAAVLGALMLDKDALIVVVDILKAESFYKKSNQDIYKAILKLFEDSNPVDLLTVTEELKKQGTLDQAGGAYYLVELTNRVASAANVEYHARIIAQKHIQRALIETSTKTIKDAYEDTTDVFELLDSAEKGLFDITENNMRRSYETMQTLTAKAMKQIEEMSMKEEGLTGVPSGFVDLDRMTSGWQPSDLIILAARPGMGKTSFSLALALNAARDFGKAVAVFSLEMSNVQLVQRFLSLEAEISGSKMRNGQLENYEWQQLQSAVEKISDLPIFIDDTPGLNVFELRAKCRRLKMQHDIQFIVIDYLQLMTAGSSSGGGNREQEISMISRSLKGLAKELNVPVMALSQLNRSVETRGGDKKPQLADLRESGAIEQDADIVSFIYRPEYYNILEDEEGMPLKGIGEIIIAKHRNGALGSVRMKFTAQYAKFSDLDDPTFGSLPDENMFQKEDSVTTHSSRLNDDIPF